MVPEDTTLAGTCVPTCPPPTLRWGIPAGILNSLWCDFFPRLVARTWQKQGVIPRLKRLDGTPELTAALIGLESTMAAASPAWGASEVLLRRLAEVRGFFEANPNFPFLIAGHGGYDFLLSDWGVEFFMPSLPYRKVKDKRRELFRYYAFRKTGGPSLGLPGYLDGVSLVSIDAPTGPNQIVVGNPDALLTALGVSSTCPAGQALRARWKVRRDVTGEEYLCGMRPFRCWQVEGATYRGFAVELPRVIATKWMEEEDGPVPTTSYSKRLGTTEGLRRVLEERLETMLPPQSTMDFRFMSGGEGSGQAWWNPKDAMITNKGFYFPRPRRPKLDDMLQAIVDGRAGNPVFTDSKRTQQ